MSCDILNKIVSGPTFHFHVPAVMGPQNGERNQSEAGSKKAD